MASYIDVAGQSGVGVRAAKSTSCYMGLFWLSVFCSSWASSPPWLYFGWRYRYKPGRVTPHQTHNTTLEIVWTVIPTLICRRAASSGASSDYMKFAVAPGEAMEIQVVGKQWLWTFEYPDGTRSVNELHVPVNKNIRLVMTSEDVLHDFYVPDMRIKRDIVPGRYTQEWFRPMKARSASTRPPARNIAAKAIPTCTPR